MRGVAAPHGLRGVERQVVAQGDERVLQRRARARVRVDVAGRDASGRPSRSRQLGQRAVARAVVALERALQLDAQVRRARRRRAAGAASARRARPWSRAAAQADEARRRAPPASPAARAGGGSSLVAGSCACARVRMRQRLRQPRRVLDQQRDVAAVVEVDLRAVDRPQAERRRRPARTPSSPTRRCGRSARTPHSRARPRRPPARRAARRRRGRRRRSGHGARRTWASIERMFA